MGIENNTKFSVYLTLFLLIPCIYGQNAWSFNSGNIQCPTTRLRSPHYSTVCTPNSIGFMSNATGIAHLSLSSGVWDMVGGTYQVDLRMAWYNFGGRLSTISLIRANVPPASRVLATFTPAAGERNHATRDWSLNIPLSDLPRFSSYDSPDIQLVFSSSILGTTREELSCKFRPLYGSRSSANDIWEQQTILGISAVSSTSFFAGWVTKRYESVSSSYSYDWGWFHSARALSRGQIVNSGATFTFWSEPGTVDTAIYSGTSTTNSMASMFSPFSGGVSFRAGAGGPSTSVISYPAIRWATIDQERKQCTVKLWNNGNANLKKHYVLNGPGIIQEPNYGGFGPPDNYDFQFDEDVDCLSKFYIDPNFGTGSGPEANGNRGGGALAGKNSLRLRYQGFVNEVWFNVVANTLHFTSKWWTPVNLNSVQLLSDTGAPWGVWSGSGNSLDNGIVMSVETSNIAAPFSGIFASNFLGGSQIRVRGTATDSSTYSSDIIQQDLKPPPRLSDFPRVEYVASTFSGLNSQSAAVARLYFNPGTKEMVLSVGFSVQISVCSIVLRLGDSSDNTNNQIFWRKEYGACFAAGTTATPVQSHISISPGEISFEEQVWQAISRGGVFHIGFAPAAGQEIRGNFQPSEWVDSSTSFTARKLTRVFLFGGGYVYPNPPVAPGVISPGVGFGIINFDETSANTWSISGSFRIGGLAGVGTPSITIGKAPPGGIATVTVGGSTLTLSSTLAGYQIFSFSSTSADLASTALFGTFYVELSRGNDLIRGDSYPFGKQSWTATLYDPVSAAKGVYRATRIINGDFVSPTRNVLTDLWRFSAELKDSCYELSGTTMQTLVGSTPICEAQQGNNQDYCIFGGLPFERGTWYLERQSNSFPASSVQSVSINSRYNNGASAYSSKLLFTGTSVIERSLSSTSHLGLLNLEYVSWLDVETAKARGYQTLSAGSSPNDLVLNGRFLGLTLTYNPTTYILSLNAGWDLRDTLGTSFTLELRSFPKSGGPAISWLTQTISTTLGSLAWSSDFSGNYEAFENGLSGNGFSQMEARLSWATTSGTYYLAGSVQLPGSNNEYLRIGISPTFIYQATLKRNSTGQWVINYRGSSDTIANRLDLVTIKDGYYQPIFPLWSGALTSFDTNSIASSVAINTVNPSPVLSNNDNFGAAVTTIGDVDGDGIVDSMVGAPGDDETTVNSGSVFVQFRNRDGTIKSTYKIKSAVTGFSYPLNAQAALGTSVVALGDVDGDSIPDVAVGAPGDTDGGTDRGAVYILFLNRNGSVKKTQKISQSDGGFGTGLSNSDKFGSALTAGDFNKDGVIDLVVGAPGDSDGGTARGAIWFVFLRNNGTVISKTKISSTVGGLTGLVNNGRFGSSICNLGDLNVDGNLDLAVGAPGDDTIAANSGAVYTLLLTNTYTVSSQNKFTDGVGPLVAGDSFGTSIALLGDWNGDSIQDIVVGVPGKDIGSANSGAIQIIYLTRTGSKLAGGVEINSASQNVAIGAQFLFGSSIALIGDLNGDSILDLQVGAVGATTGMGVVYTLFLRAAQAPVTTHKLFGGIGSPIPTDNLNLLVSAFQSGSLFVFRDGTTNLETQMFPTSGTDLKVWSGEMDSNQAVPYVDSSTTLGRARGWAHYNNMTGEVTYYVAYTGIVNLDTISFSLGDTGTVGTITIPILKNSDSVPRPISGVFTGTTLPTNTQRIATHQYFTQNPYYPYINPLTQGGITSGSFFDIGTATRTSSIRGYNRFSIYPANITISIDNACRKTIVITNYESRDIFFQYEWAKRNYIWPTRTNLLTRNDTVPALSSITIAYDGFSAMKPTLFLSVEYGKPYVYDIIHTKKLRCFSDVGPICNNRIRVFNNGTRPLHFTWKAPVLGSSGTAIAPPKQTLVLNVASLNQQHPIYFWLHSPHRPSLLLRKEAKRRGWNNNCPGTGTSIASRPFNLINPFGQERLFGLSSTGGGNGRLFEISWRTNGVSLSSFSFWNGQTKNVLPSLATGPDGGILYLPEYDVLIKSGNDASNRLFVYTLSRRDWLHGLWAGGSSPLKYLPSPFPVANPVSSMAALPNSYAFACWADSLSQIATVDYRNGNRPFIGSVTGITTPRNSLCGVRTTTPNVMYILGATAGTGSSLYTFTLGASTTAASVVRTFTLPQDNIRGCRFLATGEFVVVQDNTLTYYDTSVAQPWPVRRSQTLTESAVEELG